MFGKHAEKTVIEPRISKSASSSDLALPPIWESRCGRLSLMRLENVGIGSSLPIVKGGNIGDFEDIGDLGVSFFCKSPKLSIIPIMSVSNFGVLDRRMLIPAFLARKKSVLMVIPSLFEERHREYCLLVA